MFQNLDTIPDKSDPYLWADFAEIRALLSIDKCFTRGDLSSVECRNTDLGKRSFKVENKWKDIISFIEIRTIDFYGTYPFEVSEDGDTLICSSDAGDDCYAPYLALLLCASLRHVVKSEASKLANQFEEISLCVFKNLMPNNSEIRPTWASGGKEAPYKGNLYNKMLAIAADLRCKHPNFDEDDFKKQDTGDGGMDMIAWHPMGDTRDGMPIAWAQCGCSKDQWDAKQLEASPSKHYRKIPVMHPWSAYYFMPLDMRKPNGDWANKSDLGSVIFVDRFRLLKLADEFNVLQDFPVVSLVAKALKADIQL